MAGDWIKIESATPNKPEVDLIAEILGVSVNEVIGGLVRLWIWADQQTINGNAPSVTKNAIDRHSGVTGLADAMISDRVGWLVETDSGGFLFPNFDRHNGQTAKTRGLTAKRVAECKKRSSNAPSVTSALPREEKRREEKRSSDDHVFDFLKKNNHTFSAATDWCKTQFRQGVGGKPPLFTAAQATSSRKFLLQVAALALCGEYPEAWVAEALEAMRRLEKPPANPGGYLRKLLRASPHIRGRPPGWFDGLLNSIDVPES